MLNLKRKNSKRGFTLIELIVVIAILGILAAILVPSMLGIVNDSKKSVSDADARTVYSAATAAYVKVVADGTNASDIAGTSATTPTANKTFLDKVALDLGAGFDAKYNIYVSADGVTSVEIVDDKDVVLSTYPVPATSSTTSVG